MTKPTLTSLFAYGPDIGDYAVQQQFSHIQQSEKPYRRQLTNRKLAVDSKTYVRLVCKSESERQFIEQFIRRQYRHHFSAEINHFFPVLISIYLQSNDELIGTVGIRYADQGDLFAEQYLDRPVEQLLTQFANQKVPRSAVIELGHFAIKRRRYLALVVNAITCFIGQLQAQWTVYTLSQPMVKTVNKLRIPTQFLANACADKLVDKSSHWGQYYSLQPAVYCSHIGTAIKAINNKQLTYDNQ